MRWPRVALAAASVAMTIFACREVTQPFESVDRPALPYVEPTRITHSPRDDRAPTWNATSDTVYYSGFSEDFAPVARATLLAMHRAGGGLARPVLRNAQVGSNASRWLMLPLMDVARDRIMFVDLPIVLDSIPCLAPELHCPSGQGFSPQLRRASVHVRDIDAEYGLPDDDILVFELEGYELDSVTVRPGFATYRTRFHPFQFDFSRNRELPFRGSWSPDGSRVVTSDGMRVLLWDPATGAAEPIMGTEDGVSPSWSPAGDRIAYTWIERLDSATVTCSAGKTVTIDGMAVFVPWCYERRTNYELAPARIVIVRNDGTDRQIIAEGRDPTWDPQGRLYYSGSYEVSDPIRRFDFTTGTTLDIPGTEGGREAAISPDGRWLAFSRAVRITAPRDIYVVPLP